MHNMYDGGLENKPHSVQIFRLAGLFIPILLISYGFLLQIGAIKTNHNIDSLGFIIISFWWLYVSIIQFVFPIKTKLDATMRLISYHLLAGSYLVYVSGIFSPITICWLLLILASYLLFSFNGFLMSYFGLIIVIMIDISSINNNNETILVNNMIVMLSILITSLAILSILQDQETSKKELLKSKAKELLEHDRIITIINNLSDAVISTDTDGFIKVYNAACLNLLDTNININGHYIDEILPLIDQNKNKIRMFEELKNSKTVTKRDDLKYVFNKDDEIRIEITHSPIRSSYNNIKKLGTNDGYILIIRDITKAKSLEEGRDEFISVISHELRTPIAVSEGAISNTLMMINHPDVTKSMLTDSIKMAYNQITFLAGMVNDLSALSRAERGVADNSEKIDVKELAHNLLKKYSEDAKTKKLHLNLDLSPKLEAVMTSRLYLEELLQDFITNAIKYTKKGSVTIDFKQKKNNIIFSIKDTGIGVSNSDKQKIFDKFYRSEDYRTRESSGTGLGLYIAEKLSHKLGTNISLTSRLNHGSTFSFILPVHEITDKSIDLEHPLN